MCVNLIILRNGRGLDNIYTLSHWIKPRDQYMYCVCKSCTIYIINQLEYLTGKRTEGLGVEYLTGKRTEGSSFLFIIIYVKLL